MRDNQTPYSHCRAASNTTATRILAGCVTALATSAVTIYAAADYLFRFALDTHAKVSLLTMSQDDSSDHDERLDTAEERDAEQWYEQSRQGVEITNAHGLRLHAWRFDPDCLHPHEHLYAICCHGFSGAPEQMAKYAHRFAKMGFSVLTPASRAHELSEGRYIGMGWLEHDDLLQWIGAIVEQDPHARILLHGISMGAATISMACGDARLPDNVVAAICDCGFSSTRDQFMYSAKTLYHLPSAAAFPVITAMSRISKHRAGYTFEEASSINQLRHSDIPMLFIHGDADTFVPPCALYRNFEACSSHTKQRLLIHGAGHAMSASTDPVTYWSRVDEFIRQMFGL